MVSSQKTTQEIFNRLLEDKENQICFDCGKSPVQWASISHGIFLCWDCSSVHRNLGVHISFVRSVIMDSWNIKHLLFMTNGGNRQFSEFLNKYDIPNQPQILKYQTYAAKWYRQWLKAIAEELQMNTPPPSQQEGGQLIDQNIQQSPGMSLQQVPSYQNYQNSQYFQSQQQSSFQGFEEQEQQSTLQKIFNCFASSPQIISQKLNWSQDGDQDGSTIKEKVKNGAISAVNATVNGAQTAYEKTKEVSSAIIEKAKDSFVRILIQSSEKLIIAAAGTSAVIYGGLAYGKEGISKVLEKTGIKSSSNNETSFLRMERNLKESFYLPPSQLNSLIPKNF